jgi:hypothetical protein
MKGYSYDKDSAKFCIDATLCMQAHSIFQRAAKIPFGLKQMQKWGPAAYLSSGLYGSRATAVSLVPCLGS